MGFGHGRISIENATHSYIIVFLGDEPTPDHQLRLRFSALLHT